MMERQAKRKVDQFVTCVLKDCNLFLFQEHKMVTHRLLWLLKPQDIVLNILRASSV